MGLDNPLHIAFLVVILLLVFGAKPPPAQQAAAQAPAEPTHQA
jgi:hypothetical protein